jgi:hypothetical protein
MANCPKCGSEHIQLKRETNVSWGRAIVGYALLGVVGGAVGAVTGEDRNANACLDCGTSWKAAALYDVLQFIKKETGLTIDLSLDNHRAFLSDVMPEISSYSEKVATIDNQTRIEIEGKKKGQSGGGCGCLIGLIIAGILSISNPSAFIVLAFFIGIIGSLIGQGLEKKDEATLNAIRDSNEILKSDALKGLRDTIQRSKTRYLPFP